MVLIIRDFMERTIRQVEFPVEAPTLTRVAAYARVSSGKDAMLHSLSAQVSYYSNLIQKHPGWQYCGVYADEALTGTKDTRENFQRLLTDCRAGKLDLIITKSISRFARNTVTLLETVRELKLLGINVYFEEQNIFTLSADGELMMTILASYAQEESRSASENQKWRIRANFKDGLPWNGTVLGYRIENGVYEPVAEEAELVQLIFSLYNGGWGTYKIAKFLNKSGYRTRRGKQWTHGSLQKLLNNYAYTGNLLLQTTFMEAIEREMNAPTATPLTTKPETTGKLDTKTGRASDVYRQNFWNVMRSKNPDRSITDALQIGTDSEGGYLVPDEFERTLVDGLQENNMRIKMHRHINSTNRMQTNWPVSI